MDQENDAGIYKDHFQLTNNATEEEILILLMRMESLTCKQIARKMHRGYKTIYEYLQRMKGHNMIVKNELKKYSLNPEYAKFLVYQGLRMLGMNNHTRILLEYFISCMKKKITLFGKLIVFITKCLHSIVNNNPSTQRSR